MRNWDNMVNIQDNFSCPTHLAGKIVSSPYFSSKDFINAEIEKSTFVPSPITMFGAGSCSIGIIGFSNTFIPRLFTSFSIEPFFFNCGIVQQDLMKFFEIEERLMPRFKTHSFQTGVGTFFHPFIPGFDYPELAFSASRGMTPDIFRVMETSLVNRERKESFSTTTLADLFNFHGLFFRYSHENEYTGKLEESQEKLGELLETPNVKTRAISSQAAMGEGIAEGSTTIGVSPNNNPRQERPTRKGRYSLSIGDNPVSVGLNGQRVTKLNAIPYTGKLEVVSQEGVRNLVVKALKNDQVKVLDAAVEAQMNACYYRYVSSTTTSGNFTTDGTATATATTNLNAYHFKVMVDKLMALNAPPADGENYMAILTISAARGIYDSLEDIWEYTKYPVNGEIGSYYRCRVVRDNYAMDNTIGASSITGEGYFFGDDAVMEAVALPEEIRYEEEDFGRSKKLAWYAILGFKIIWSSDPDDRIIKWDSA